MDQLDLTVLDGESVAVFGPNGAGKTTLFNCVAGIENPTAGQIILTRGDRTISIGGKKPEAVTGLGIARTFQNIRLFDNLTVIDNVKIGRHCRTRSVFFGAVIRSKFQQAEEKAISESAYQYLEFVGLKGRGQDIARSMAYGDQRRLEIARALATEPRLLMLDEPAAGMNPQETIEITGFIKTLRDKFGYTILVIEHKLNVVRTISDRMSCSVSKGETGK